MPDESLSVGIVTIISGLSSLSKLATIGPGSRIWGTFESPSKFPSDLPSQLGSPLDESSFQSHIAPFVDSVVVSITYAVFSSVCTNTGSDPWLPYPRLLLHNIEGDPEEGKETAITWGELSDSLIAEITSSASPSRSKSARSG